MNLEYPYQLVAFLDKEPAIGEPVYYGENGWYPQLALKRRFKPVGTSEESIIESISKFVGDLRSFTIQTGNLVKPERMPVQVIEILNIEELVALHTGLLAFLGASIESRYPDREGDNFLPHITAEFNGEMVVDAASVSNQQFKVNRLCLLKDIDDENSRAHHYFELQDI